MELTCSSGLPIVHFFVSIPGQAVTERVSAANFTGCKTEHLKFLD